MAAALLTGCGGSKTKSPEEVVSRWSHALNAGDNEAAADLFADGAVVRTGQPVTLEGHEDAVAFNSSLPCGGRIVEKSLQGGAVTATFTLTRRPDHIGVRRHRRDHGHRVHGRGRQDHPLAAAAAVPATLSG